jgi:hypothetical protein
VRRARFSERLDMTTTLLQNARHVRRQLEESPRWRGKTSIRDAVEVAADNLRQITDEGRD